MSTGSDSASATDPAVPSRGLSHDVECTHFQSRLVIARDMLETIPVLLRAGTRGSARLTNLEVGTLALRAPSLAV